MTQLRALDPFALDPLFDEPFGFVMPWRTSAPERSPQIRVDVTESDGQYLIKAEVPGVRKEDLDVNINDNQVSISAEVKKEAETKEGGRVLRSERRYGWIRRSIWLDSSVDQAKASAHYHDGLLELTLPKRAATTMKHLEIR